MSWVLFAQIVGLVLLATVCVSSIVTGVVEAIGASRPGWLPPEPSDRDRGDRS